MIDCHFHLWTEDESTPEKRAERAEQIRGEMELQNVDRICLIGEVGNTVEECREANRTVAKYVEEYPDLFYGWARVDPRLGEEAVEEFRRAVQEDGLVGLKHHFGGTPVNISEPEFYPLAEAAVEMDVPIISHVMQRLEQDKEDWDDSEAHTEDVMHLATRYPELKLITAHIVAGGDAEYRIKNIADQDNVYVDISGSNCQTGLIEMAAERCGVDRLVWGTDTWFAPGVGKLDSVELPPEEKAEIAFNFETLLSDDVPNRYSETELAERKAAQVERFERSDEERAGTEVVDANAYVGRWPYRELESSPEELVALMDRKNVDRAVVSSLDAVLLRNSHRGNRKLADEITGYEDRLIPFATINPSYTAWREDLAECLDDLDMAGVRLFPLHHYYDLDDPEVRELFEICAERDVPVMIAGPLEDQRHRHPTMTLHGFEDGGTRNLPKEQVDALIDTLGACQETDVILANLWGSAPRIVEEVCEVTPSGVRLDNVTREGETLIVLSDLYLYFSHQAEQLVDDVGVERLVTGPRLPFHHVDSYDGYVDLLPVDDEDKQRVRADNVLSVIE